jgi:ABC-type branched-subunit amino acid transport system substrate-binding protein
MDLVIGPLYPGPSQAAGEWALKNQINVVNPLSMNPDYVRNNPYVFLYKPSLVTQAEKAADFAARTFPSRRAVVVYGASNKRDSLMAASYYDRLRGQGFERIKMVGLKKGEERTVADYLSSSTPSDSENGGRFSADSIGHIFVASEDRLVVSSTISALTGRSNQVPLIGLGSWIASSSKGESLVSYTQAERLGAYLLAPEYVDYSNPNFFTFRDKYVEEVHAMPSEYAYQGYDLMMYFGNLLKKHGTIFQNSLDKEPFTKGQLCAGFDYAGKQDNQCVPVVQFRNSALEVVFQ